MSFLDNIVSAKSAPRPESEQKGPPPAYRTIPLPRVSAITCLQAAFIDNGPNRRAKNGRKSTGQQYKMTLEAWIVPLPVNKKYPQYKRSIDLRDANPFLTLIDGQLKNGVISDEYHKLLGDFVLGIGIKDRDDFMFGQLWESPPTGGKKYEEMKFIVVTSNSNNEMEAYISTSEGDIMITGFTDRFATGVVKLTAEYKP